MAKQRVGENESTSSLAKRHGFYWKTIWEHGENAELRQKRKDPNVLAADDQIFIPKLEQKKVSVGTESEHVFVRKGEPTEIKMQLLELGEPRKNAPYIFVVNGVSKNGQTDGEGILKQFVPGDAKKAMLYFKDGAEEHKLRIGSLDPTDLASGIVQRLNMLSVPRPFAYMMPRLYCAPACPCSAARRYQSMARFMSCFTPSPLA